MRLKKRKIRKTKKQQAEELILSMKKKDLPELKVFIFELMKLRGCRT